MKTHLGFALIAGTVLLASCGSKEQETPPMAVSYAVAQSQNMPLYREFVGQIQAVNDVQIRPRVTGIVVSRTFVEGGFVTKDQPLFVIDPREYKAQLASAQADLASAQASAAKAAQDVARYGPLVKADAIARQTYDAAVATSRANVAQVAAASAGVDQARIALSYTTVRSPMNGQIGEALMDVGSLVSPSGPEMAQVSDLNPIAVYFNPSEQDMLEFQRQSAGQQATSQKFLKLELADGTEFPFDGQVDFANRALNPQTGSLEVRAMFPNPRGDLRPGMFGRVRFMYSEQAGAVVVPDRAVVEQLGSRFIYVVGAGTKVEQRKVEVGAHVGGNWIVNSGIKPGDKVLVDGQQKVQSGMVVDPKLATTDAAVPKKAAARK